MKKQRYIDWKYFPVRNPFGGTVMWVTVLHYWNAPQWAWTLILAALSILWITWLIWVFYSEKIKEPPFDL